VLRERRSTPAVPLAASASAAVAKQNGGLLDKWVESVKKGTIDRVKGWIIIDWDAWCPTWFKNGTKTSYEWWTRERVHKLVENGVPNKDLDLVVFDSTFFSFPSAWYDLVADVVGEYSVEPLRLCVVDGRSVRRRAEGYTQDSRSDG
jgi:hypothetical protein